MTAKIEERGHLWETKAIALDTLRYDRDLQPREEPLIEGLVNKYAQAMRDGRRFPAIQVAQIGASFFVLDGHHRVAAARQAGFTSIAAEVTKMTRKQASLYVLGTNNHHGERLNRKDKERVLAQYVLKGFHLRPDDTVKSSRLMERELNKVLTHPTITKHLRKQGIEPGKPQDDGFEIGEWDYGENDVDEPEVPLSQPELLAQVNERLAALELLTDQLDDEPTIRAARDLIDALARRLSNRVAGHLDI